MNINFKINCPCSESLRLTKKTDARQRARMKSKPPSTATTPRTAREITADRALKNASAIVTGLLGHRLGNDRQIQSGLKVRKLTYNGAISICLSTGSWIDCRSGAYGQELVSLLEHVCNLSSHNAQRLINNFLNDLERSTHTKKHRGSES